MTDVAATLTLDLEEQRARIDRAQEETRKFAAEQHKLAAERSKLWAEADKLARDRALAPWQIVIATATASAALMGAGAALAKLLGH